MNQPYLFRDSLRVICALCNHTIQDGDRPDAPVSGGICEECERIDLTMRRDYVQTVNHQPDPKVA